MIVLDVAFKASGTPLKPPAPAAPPTPRAKKCLVMVGEDDRFHCDVKINGRIALPFLLDTGARTSMVPVEVLVQAGIRVLSDSPVVRVRGLTEDCVHAREIRADLLFPFGINMPNSPLLAVEDWGWKTSGLIGMNILGRFQRVECTSSLMTLEVAA